MTSKGILIKDEAFKGCSNLKTVTLNCVSSIGQRAFSDCSSLETVQINEESLLQYVGMFAFENCTALRSLIIPDGCEVIDAYAFSGASNLALYCEASSQPEKWSREWNYYNATVYWDYIFDSYRVDLDYDGATGNASVTYRFSYIRTINVLSQKNIENI